MRVPAAFVTLACICQASIAHAAITSRDTAFLTECLDQAATAFTWKQGSFGLVPYYPNIYRIEKRPASSAGCALILEAKSALSGTFDDISYGCYRVTPLAQNTTPPVVCVEHWASPESDATLKSVTCAGDAPYHWILFDPAGAFQFAQLSTDLDTPPAGEVKDPLILSIGSCKIVRQS